jgi:F-type H+-transporting ATPase subunit a
MAIFSTLLCIFGFFVVRAESLVPTRVQYVFEVLHGFIGELVKTNIGREGRPYFPYIFTLFIFIFFANIFGMLPYSFTVTSHISITLSLALFVWSGATLVGIIKHGWHFFRLFFPTGAPVFVAPILVPIEIISYLSRPVSLAARLFANMVAGHVMIKIFAGFFTMLPETYGGMAMGIVPILFNVLLTGFEVVIAFLQAYVFTILSCIYFNDTLNIHE